MIGVVVVYTLLGGMVSVVLTDFAQFILLSLGFLFGTYCILTHPDLGWDGVVAAVERHKGADGFDPFSSYGGWFILYFFAINLMAILWQPEMSRPLSSASPDISRRIFWISGATAMGRALIPMFWGAAALAYLGSADLDGRFAMPVMMGQILPIGLAGLLLAGMFAAFMSTHDSYLLAWSGVIVRDVLSPLKAILRGDQPRRHMAAGGDRPQSGLSSEREIYWTRVVVVILAAFLAFFGAVYQPPESSFKYMYITGTIYLAGTVGTVALGLYWRRANSVGAYCALVLGAVAPINFLVMSQMPEQVPAWLLPLVERSDLPALLSLVLGGLGMIVGAALTQRSHPPRPLDFTDTA